MIITITISITITLSISITITRTITITITITLIIIRRRRTAAAAAAAAAAATRWMLRLHFAQIRRCYGCSRLLQGCSRRSDVCISHKSVDVTVTVGRCYGCSRLLQGRLGGVVRQPPGRVTEIVYTSRFVRGIHPCAGAVLIFSASFQF